MFKVLSKKNFWGCKYISQLYLSKQTPSIKEIRSVVTPHIDLDPMINDRANLESSLLRRGLSENLDQLKVMWDSYKTLLGQKSTIEEKREKNKQSLINIKSESNTSPDVDQLKSLGKSLRNEFRDTLVQITNLENIIIPRILNLPNNLSPNVSGSEIVIRSFKECYSNDFNHLITGKVLGVLDFVDPYTYYFKDIAAKYELAICRFITRKFCDSGYVGLSNPDFSRLPLIEGWINEDVHKHLLELDKLFWTGDHDGLYLNGGAHILMFYALHVNSIVDRDCLPLKYVSQGRCYNSIATNSFGGLYNVRQNTSVNFFIGTNKSDVASEHQQILDTIWNFYRSLNLPVRLVYTPTSHLLSCESLRISVQIFSPNNNKFVEVGCISKTDDFISKRLRMYFRNDDDLTFFHVIHGTVVNVPVIVACLLEHDPIKSISMLKDHLNIFEIK